MLRILSFRRSLGGSFLKAASVAVSIGGFAGFSAAEAVYDAIQNHPTVSGYRSQVCQALSQSDQARATIRPQITGQLTGGSSLSSKIESASVRARDFDSDNFDIVISVRQILYDWGNSSASVNIAENHRQSSFLSLQIESDRVAADILGILLSQAELKAQDSLYDGHVIVLKAIEERIERGVEAGVDRLSDLRSIKITLLESEVAHERVKRQIEILETDLSRRFGLTFDEAQPLLDRYLQNRADEPLVSDSLGTREVKRLDYNLDINKLELQRLKAQRRPGLNAILDTTLFDVDDFDGEYEVVGRIQFTMPIYDGGSNKALRDETTWRGNSIASERDNLIRNHRSQVDQIVSQAERLRLNAQSNKDQINHLEQQLAAMEAREGQTENNPLQKAALVTELLGLLVTQESLKRELELEYLRSIFFGDQLGQVIKLNYGASPC